jgi:hypothetical protein
MRLHCICGHLRTRFLFNTQSWPSPWVVRKQGQTNSLRHFAPLVGFHLRTFADTELVSGCPCPGVGNSWNPAKSGHYPARRYFAWPSQASDRKRLSFKHIRRHRASSIGLCAIYPAMEEVPQIVARDQWLVARKRAKPSANAQPTDVRNCPQSTYERSSSIATNTVIAGISVGMRGENRWLPTEVRMSGNVRNDKGRVGSEKQQCPLSNFPPRTFN